jgi:hypothetical protein
MYLYKVNPKDMQVFVGTLLHMENFMKKNLDTTSGRETYYLLLLCSLSLIPYRHLLYNLLTFSGKGAQQTQQHGQEVVPRDTLPFPHW